MSAATMLDVASSGRGGQNARDASKILSRASQALPFDTYSIDSLPDDQHGPQTAISTSLR